MKIHWIILFLVGGLIVSSCHKKNELKDRSTSNEDTILVLAKSYLTFNQKEHDIGTINRKNVNKESINIYIEFINKSEQPITIKKVDISCGCISVNFPNKPILPKKRGSIVVFVNIEKLKGYFVKQIFVNSNAENSLVILTVKGDICE